MLWQPTADRRKSDRKNLLCTQVKEKSSIPDWSCQWNMLVFKFKPCKFKYMKIYFETAKGSLEQLKSNRCNDYLDNECNSFANTCTMIDLIY